MPISITSNAREALKRWSKGGPVSRQVPFATARALNDAAFDSIEDLKGEMGRAFDGPTRYTLNAFTVYRGDMAKKTRLRATIRQKSDVSGRVRSYLKTQVEGGERRHKAFERLLQARGAMPRGRVFVPADNAKLNKYGNMSGARVTQMLSDLGAQREVGSLSNATDSSRKRSKRRRHFTLGPKGAPVGIARRAGRGGRNLLLIGWYVKRARYESRLDFDGTLAAAARGHFPSRFAARLAMAVKAAR